jgi:peptide/nickel transport system permease protein
VRIVRITFIRLLRLVATFLIVTFLANVFLSLAPGSPAEFIAGDAATPEGVQAINDQYNFDEPLISRYFSWLGDFLQGDLGISYISRIPVVDIIKERLPVTAELAILAMLLSLVVSVPLAIAAARRQGGRLDRFLAGLASATISVPSFVVATLLVYFFAFQIHIFPSLGWTRLSDDVLENLKGCVLPVISIALGETVVLLRVLRADLIATLQQDYIALARAKGLSTRAIMWKHALRPSSFSLLTLTGLGLARFLGGTVIVESIFILPGLGTLTLQSVTAKDLVVVQGVVVFFALAFLVINFIVDILYGVLDPRTRVRA